MPELEYELTSHVVRRSYAVIGFGLLLLAYLFL